MKHALVLGGLFVSSLSFGWTLQSGQSRASISFSDSRFSAIGKVRTRVGSCTGTLVGPDLVLTAAHCVDPYEFRLNQTYGGDYKNKADVISVVRVGDTSSNPRTSGNDWAILRLDRELSHSWMSVSRSSPSNGARLIAVGYSFDYNEGTHPVADSGCVMGVNVGNNYLRFNQCEWMKGASGGPILSCSGYSCSVVGVLSGEGSTGYNYAVASPAFADVVRNLQGVFSGTRSLPAPTPRSHSGGAKPPPSSARAEAEALREALRRAIEEVKRNR